MQKESDPINPVLVEDVASGNPPPSYEEVMGQYMTSVKQSQEELAPLSYIDIMPRLLDPGNMKNKIAPTFQKFSDIMNGANVWLKSNPGLKVWKCETVERKVDIGPVVHLESTLLHESSYGANYYVFGVRMWLTQRQNPAEPVQELGLLNVPPPVKEIPVTLSTRGGFGMLGMGMGGLSMGGAMPMMMGFWRRGRMVVVTQGMLQTYENLSKAVENYNEVTKEEPLKGCILNVETTSVKFGDGFSGKEADPDVTSWSETGKSKAFSTRRFTKILRIFYVKGPPKHEQLSMVSFLPRVLKEPEASRSAQFEKFDVVLLKVQQWLQTQSGIRVVNLETANAKYTYGFGADLVCDIHFDPDSFERPSSDFAKELSASLNYRQKNKLKQGAVPTIVDTSCVDKKTGFVIRLSQPREVNVVTQTDGDARKTRRDSLNKKGWISQVSAPPVSLTLSVSASD
ncbi:hypothetical protein ACOMHN_033395 [Nucella lapillus]